MDEMRANDDNEDRQPGRALVALGSVRVPGRNGGPDRPLTDFLAQLIACDRRFPAYRTARRTESETGVSAYSGIHPIAAVSRLDLSV